MIRKTLLHALALALCLVFSDPAWSAPPQINENHALRRTARGDVGSHDQRLEPRGKPPAGRAVWLSSRSAREIRRQGRSVQLEVEIDRRGRCGRRAYPIRVQTDDGISNPFLFVVGQLPQILEKEDNSTFEAASRSLSLPWLSRVMLRAMTSTTFDFTGGRGRRSLSTRHARGSARESTRQFA